MRSLLLVAALAVGLSSLAGCGSSKSTGGEGVSAPPAKDSGSYDPAKGKQSRFPKAPPP